jgi:5-methyltetrahydrofolate--homocysteine methyltransferase
MPNMETTIQAISEAGLRKDVKIIIGGAPVTEDYAIKIGADGFAPDASQAASLAKSLVS